MTGELTDNAGKPRHLCTRDTNERLDKFSEQCKRAIFAAHEGTIPKYVLTVLTLLYLYLFSHSSAVRQITTV